MNELSYHTLDVFTAEPFSGNQLAIIPDSSGLNDELMQTIAREFNYPETVFVQPASHMEALCRLRIFTPQSELPFAGHPTIGTAQLLHELGMTLDPVDGACEFYLEEGIGLVPVSVTSDVDGNYFTWLTAAQLPQGASITPDKSELALMLGLDADQIAFEHHAPCVYTAGVPFTLIPLRDREALRNCRLDLARWRELLADSEAPQVYVFCPSSNNSDVDFHTRMFAPALGVPEDPATGAAATAFAGYLHERLGLSNRCVISQGEDMGRPSKVYLDILTEHDKLQTVRVGGTAVRVCQGQIRLP